MILKALAKNAEERFQSAGEMVEAIQKDIFDSGRHLSNTTDKTLIESLSTSTLEGSSSSLGALKRSRQVTPFMRSVGMTVGGLAIVGTAILAWFIINNGTEGVWFINQQNATPLIVRITATPQVILVTATPGPTRAPRGVFVTATPDLTPAPMAFSSLPTPQGSLLFSEDFEDGIANGFSYSGGVWKVADDGTGNKAFEAASSSSDYPYIEFGPRAFSDGTIEFATKIISRNSDVGLRFRRGPLEGYVFALLPRWNLLQISYENERGGWTWVTINGGETSYSIQGKTWYLVRLEIQGNTIKAYLNDVLQMTAEDSRIKAGVFAFGLGLRTGAQFDNVRVWGP